MFFMTLVGTSLFGLSLQYKWPIQPIVTVQLLQTLTVQGVIAILYTLGAELGPFALGLFLNFGTAISQVICFFAAPLQERARKPRRGAAWHQVKPPGAVSRLRSGRDRGRASSAEARRWLSNLLDFNWRSRLAVSAPIKAFFVPLTGRTWQRCQLSLHIQRH